MGSLQQATVPVPPLVTMNSDPHFAQIYLLPVSLATCLLLDFGVKNHHRLPDMICNTTMGNCHYRQRSKGIQLGWHCPLGSVQSPFVLSPSKDHWRMFLVVRQVRFHRDSRPSVGAHHERRRGRGEDEKTLPCPYRRHGRMLANPAVSRHRLHRV